VNKIDKIKLLRILFFTIMGASHGVNILTAFNIIQVGFMCYEEPVNYIIYSEFGVMIVGVLLFIYFVKEDIYKTWGEQE